MSHVDGRIFWDPALPDCDRDQRGQIYDAMNATLAALHQIDPAAVGLAEFGRPGNYYQRQINRWAQQYRASELEPIPEMNQLIDWVERSLPPDDGSIWRVRGLRQRSLLTRQPPMVRCRWCTVTTVSTI